MSDKTSLEDSEAYNPISYGVDDDEALPEDLYYRDILTTFKSSDEMDDIENLHETAPSAPPQPRDRPPLPTYDHSDTLYGSNTNTYTTDDNDMYVNPSLEATPKASLKPEVKTKCGDCDCGEQDVGETSQDLPLSGSQPQSATTSSCGNDGGCGCDSNTTGTPSKKSSCGTSASQQAGGSSSFGGYGEDVKNLSGPVQASTNINNYDNLGGQSNIPNLGLIYIKTWGCSHNTSDGEYMSGLLLHAGYTVTNDPDAAHVWILNSCTVKQPSEHGLFNELKRGRDLGKGVIVAGCVPQAHPSHPMLATFSGRKVEDGLSNKQRKKLKQLRFRQKQARDEYASTLVELQAKHGDGFEPAQYDELTTLQQSIEQFKQDINALKKEGQQALIQKKLDAGEKIPPELESAVANQDNADEDSDSDNPTHNNALSDENTPYQGVVSILGVDNIHRVVEVVEATLQGNSMSLLKQTNRHRPGNDLSLPKIRKNPFVEIISISTGCLNHCTYCKTKHSRGHLRSYPIGEIVDRVSQSIREGVVEVWLTSEDLGAYGHDIDVRLPDLLNAILDVMPSHTMLRMGMSNPPYFKPIINEMAKIFHHPQCYEFLHIPVQAGSDDVLNEMNREYTNYDFRLICDALLKEIPQITLATDFICGFPTETEEDWVKSVKLVEDYKFPVVFINQFYPRPNTPANAMPQLPASVLKRRSKELVTLFNSYNTREHLVGKVMDALFTDMSRDEQYLVGHNKQYDQILIPIHPQVMGKRIRVIVKEAFKHYLICEPILESIDAANTIPTILPVNYKYWSYAKYIDSNLSSFIPSESDHEVNTGLGIPPSGHSSITVTGGGSQRRPVAQGTSTQKGSGSAGPSSKPSTIDDDEDFFMFHPTPTSSSPTTATATTASSTSSKQAPPQQQQQRTQEQGTDTSIQASTAPSHAPEEQGENGADQEPHLTNIAQNKSRFATGLIDGLRANLKDTFAEITDEEVMEYAIKAVKGEVDNVEYIESEDLDPKRQIAIGIIGILLFILIFRRLL